MRKEDRRNMPVSFKGSKTKNTNAIFNEIFKILSCYLYRVFNVVLSNLIFNHLIFHDICHIL